MCFQTSVEIAARVLGGQLGSADEIRDLAMIAATLQIWTELRHEDGSPLS
jgi:hypothetical protein